MTAPAEVFAEAAAILDAAPCLWQKNRPDTAEGTCTWLAVCSAYERWAGRLVDPRRVGVNDLVEALAEVLGVEPTVYAITDWNDVRGRTKEEAVAALRSAAEVSR